jgi:hypothetical protein
MASNFDCFQRLASVCCNDPRINNGSPEMTQETRLELVVEFKGSF